MNEIDTKPCPYCAESIRAEAIKCRYCGSFVDSAGVRALTRPWLRRREGRMLAGVCVGLAEQLGVSVTLVRLGFLIGFVLSMGLALIAYVALWISMPLEPEAAGQVEAEHPRGISAP